MKPIHHSPSTHSLGMHQYSCSLHVPQHVDLPFSANVNCTNKGTGWTPCHCAAFQGHGKVLMHLMEEKPDLTAKDNAGRCVCMWALWAQAIAKWNEGRVKSVIGKVHSAME